MTYETPLRTAGRFVLAGVMLLMGVLHFTHAESFASIMPAYLPWHVPRAPVARAAEEPAARYLVSPRRFASAST
ncbi:MAG: hypothetical protein JWN04_6064 [Myxococcaceae bacterium]|nr:hypothetical protein [Myxococcaceae bacterium]